MLSEDGKIMLLTYLAFKRDASGMDIHELFTDLIRLFELPDVAEDELFNQKAKVNR